MSDYLQPGLHPDPDTLNGFVEGVLPEHERLQCLAHLAECPTCREVVYLAEPLDAEPLVAERLPGLVVTEKVPFWKRWFAPVPALSAAMVVGTLVLSFGLYQHFRSVPNAPEMVAMATHSPEPPAAEPPAPQPQAEVNQPQKGSVSAARVQAEARMSVAATEKKAAVPPPPAPAAPPLPVPPPPPAMARSELAATPPAASPNLPVRAAPSAPPASMAFDAASVKDSATQTGIAGTITDAAGGAVAGATVKLRPMTSPAIRSLTSDPKGKFDIAGLEPGRYELQVAAPGFQQMTRQVDIQPNQMARADSMLQVGSLSESISVTAEVGQVQVSSGSLARQSAVQPLPAKRAGNMLTVTGIPDLAGIQLPSHLPASATVVQGKVTLATDSAGALFRRQDSGKKWTAVKAVWGGKVVSLVALSASDSSSDAVFQLTTDGGAVWLSRDGNRWHSADQKK